MLIAKIRNERVNHFFDLTHTHFTILLLPDAAPSTGISPPTTTTTTSPPTPPHKAADLSQWFLGPADAATNNMSTLLHSSPHTSNIVPPPSNTLLPPHPILPSVQPPPST